MVTERNVTEKVWMAAASDIGKVRKQNEDFFYFSKKHNFFIICDGMGGHHSGAFASKLAAETVRDVLAQGNPLDIGKLCEDLEQNLPTPAKQLIAAVRLANRRVFSYAQASSEGRGMGTTIVAVLLAGDTLYSVHVGDSRIYRLSNSDLTQLTNDHSWLNELIEDNEISESERQHFRKKNVLTRALGTAPTVKIDLRAEYVGQNDLYLLCTDGLHNALDNDLIRSVLSADYKVFQDMVNKLVHSAKLINGSDNITAGLIQIADSSLPQAPATALQKTIPDESPRISSALDKMVKTTYSLSGAGTKRRLPVKWMATTALALSIFLLGFLVLRSNQNEKPGSEAAASALFTQQATSAAASTAPASSNGALVLLQMTDTSLVNSLRNSEDIRVLDVVGAFGKNLPVRAGKYSWAIADSFGNILYKRRDIEIGPFADSDAESSRNGALTPPSFQNKGQSGERQRANSQRRGLVYLVGSFDKMLYQNASIYVDESRIGGLERYIDSGFYLRPGTYSVSIKDANGRVLKRKYNVGVAAGETIAIEF